jgi:predicted ATPase/DNA-binding winged helix-turn-helix (wHTH) protein
MTSSAAAPLRFGRFELQSHERRLLVDGEPSALGARAFDLLQALAERPGRLVSKRALMDLVWPGVVVQENNLAAQVSQLRKVVGDDVIATIPGRGYRFNARIEASGNDAPPAAQTAVPDGATAAALPTNLPASLPALLGREDDLEALATMVDAHRLVSVVGAGGIGKSLLTQHLLAKRRTAYPQGACWVELAPISNAAALPGAIAAALGVHPGPGEPLAALIGVVAPLTMLLALDNAEHALAEVALLCRALHDAAPGLRLVVTSQAPLRLAAERVFRLGPLAVPAGPLPADQALRYGAVALFAERAQAVEGKFSMSDSNAPAVGDICRALDGLPLAIELAAARAPLLGVQRLLSSMQDRLRLLTSSRDRAAPVRQQTLRAALEWTHGFLQPREQQVFRRLGVMAGSASLELIEQVVAGDGELDRWGVIDAVDGLVDRSLVAVLDGDGDGTPRYRLLESPRAYALERLQESGERASVQRRHAMALASMFGTAYDDYFSGRIGADDWLRRLAPDLDNARDALAWAREAGETSVQLAIGPTLLRALPPSLHAERMALADACEPLIARPVPEPLQQRAWLELSCAWADTQKQRSLDAARRALALSRALDDPSGDRFMLYHALCRAASAAAQAGEMQAALAPLHELRGLENPAWPPHRLLWGTESDQVVARMQGDTVDALRRSRRLLELDRGRGSHASIALGNLVDAELAAGDALGAARSGAALVAALEGTRDEYSLAYARLNLCAAWLALDDCHQARSLAQASWPHAVMFELQHYCAAYLALLAALEGRPRSAARLLGYAEATYAALEEARETNEAAAIERARALARSAIGEAVFERLHEEGGTLSDADVGGLAFLKGE